MNLIKKASKYVNALSSVWDYALSENLVNDKWSKLKAETGLSEKNYSILACVVGQPQTPPPYLPILGTNEKEIVLELPSTELSSFYERCGLTPFDSTGDSLNRCLSKIKDAINILAMVEGVQESVVTLVRSIQVLRKEHEYLDVSYSQPLIPFSIFVSVCKDSSTISQLRVAESILHEAMHLQLTLLEGVIPIVETSSSNRYFSPWRDEKRPAQGVLHGLFVFRAIYDFYGAIYIKLERNEKVLEYIRGRRREINQELKSLDFLSSIPELSQHGQKLVEGLLKGILQNSPDRTKQRK